MNRPLVIRADASPSIGTGHVMRCLALATAWRKAGGAVYFFSHDLPGGLQARLARDNFHLTDVTVVPGSRADSTQLTAFARACHAEWIVIDGYHFDFEYVEQAASSGIRTCLISDYGSNAGPLSAAAAAQPQRHIPDLILDQNLGTDATLYGKSGTRPRLLLGPRYTLLRQEFLRAQGHQIAQVGRRLLITLGGSDPANGTMKVLAALVEGLPADLEITAVIGTANPHRTSLEAFALEHHLSIRFVMDASNMSQLMEEADLAVAAAGTTVWELCCVGLPSVLLVVAENQQRNAAELHQIGAALNLGDVSTVPTPKLAHELTALLADPERRRTMSERGRTLVDGRGVFRVWREMTAHAITFRDATASDSHQVWEWSNAPDVRAVSFSSETIPWETHQQWFQARLESGQNPFWLACSPDGQALGQVRFDPLPDGATALVSISLAPAVRGHGWGSLILWLACQKFFATSDCVRIEARIKEQNVASRRAFEKAEFQFARAQLIKNQPAVTYELTRAHLSHE